MIIFLEVLQKVLKARGEASSNIVSEQLLKIENLDDKGLLDFLEIFLKIDIDG